MPVKTLKVSYHQQDLGYFCGAAAAQMVLRAIGGKLLNQTPLYNENHGYNTIDPGPQWASPPDGLTATLVHRKPKNYNTTIALAAADSADAISRKIVWSIHHYKLAATALVSGDDHWVVVNGYDVSAIPQASDDTSYAIHSFDVKDPWPPADEMTTPSVPPHAVGDGCGSGGQRGLSPQHVTYVEWLDSYMTGVPDGYWQGKFVAVCDGDQIAVAPGVQPGPILSANDGNSIIPIEVAQQAAVTGLTTFGLYERDEWGPILHGTKPGSPLLVQRLDKVDRYYYIVPFERPRGRATAFALVDATFGDYRQCGAVAAVSDFRAEQPSAVLKRSIGRTYKLPDQQGMLVVRRQGTSVHPVYVWKPCAESLSPYFPFAMLTIGQHHLYVRIDGRVFTALHDAGPGF
jgi:hypothetical protein